MRKLLLPYIIILLIATIAACGGKTSEKITSYSPDKKILVTITGTKPNFADPFKTLITIEASHRKQALETEIYASELNDEDVKINWISPTACDIIFLQQDGSQRKFSLHHDTEELELVELQ